MVGNNSTILKLGVASLVSVLIFLPTNYNERLPRWTQRMSAKEAKLGLSDSWQMIEYIFEMICFFFTYFLGMIHVIVHVIGISLAIIFT